MNRRTLLATLLGGTVANLDLERLVWLPNKKMISIPKTAGNPGFFLSLHGLADKELCVNGYARKPIKIPDKIVKSISFTTAFAYGETKSNWGTVQGLSVFKGKTPVALNEDGSFSYVEIPVVVPLRHEVTVSQGDALTIFVDFVHRSQETGWVKSFIDLPYDDADYRAEMSEE